MDIRTEIGGSTFLPRDRFYGDRDGVLVDVAGRKNPPVSDVDDTSMIEPDAKYGVIIEPSWLTTHRVTSKATTGFTVDFGTATPDANQTFDWFPVRQCDLIPNSRTLPALR